MIIKQIPFKGLYEDIIDYINRGVSQKEDFTVFRNTGVGIKREEIIESFIQNDRYRKNVKTRAQHIILSFHKKDRDNISNEMLYTLSDKFLKERGYDNCVVYGRVHHEENVHIHMCISQNYYLTDKSCDIPKKQYMQQNRNIETLQKERYSKELSNSLVYINSKERKKEQLQKTPKATIKNRVIDVFSELADRANSLSNLSELIQQEHQDIQVYSRGNQKYYGVKSGKFSFRFSSILRPERLEVLKRLELLKEIQERNHELSKEPPSLTR